MHVKLDPKCINFICILQSVKTVGTARQEFGAATKAMKPLRQMQLSVAEAHRLYNDLVEPIIGGTKG